MEQTIKCHICNTILKPIPSGSYKCSCAVQEYGGYYLPFYLSVKADGYVYQMMFSSGDSKYKIYLASYIYDNPNNITGSQSTFKSIFEMKQSFTLDLDKDLDEQGNVLLNRFLNLAVFL